MFVILAYAQRQYLAHWARSKIIEAYLREIQPSLPFVVEWVEVDTDFEDLKSGRVSSLKASVFWEGYRALLEGPFLFLSKTEIRYEPEIRVDDAEPIRLSVEVGLSESYRELQRLDVALSQEKWGWDKWGVRLAQPALNLNWKDSVAVAQWGWKGLSYRSGDGNTSVELGELVFHAHAALNVQPLMAKSPIEFSLSLKSVEALVAEDYYQLSLSELPFSGQVELAESVDAFKSLTAFVGSKSRPWMQVHSQMIEEELRADFKTLRPLPLTTLVPSLLVLAQEELPEGLILQGGMLHFGGRVSGSLKEGLRELKVSPQIHNLSLLWPDRGIGIKNLNLEMPVHTSAKTHGSLQLEKWAFQKFVGELDSQIQLQVPSLRNLQNGQSVSFVLKSKSSSEELGLKVENLPFLVGSVKGAFTVGGSFSLQSHASLSSTPLGFLAERVCMDTIFIPPAQVGADFPDVDLTEKRIKLDGAGVVTLFGGAVKLNEISIYDYANDVPETQFQLNWGGVQLEQLGKWLNFGEMDGLVEGYAHNVTFQSWLPTGFDFLFELKPLSEDEIVFSAQAMKNFVEMVSGESVQVLVPGMVGWMAFGWPSELLGGFNIDYAGVSAYSKDGSILLETLDSTDIIEKEGKHFILYGQRFKMPLQSSRYPVVLDSTGMANFLQRVKKQLMGLKTQQPSEAGESYGESSEASELNENEDDSESQGEGDENESNESKKCFVENF